MAEPTIAEDPLFRRIRTRIDPLDTSVARDFDAYRAAKAQYGWETVEDAGRGFSLLPPLHEGMTETERNKLIRDYTGMLDSLVKLDTDLRSEEAKTKRNRQTMWSNNQGQILKYMASLESSKATTIAAAVAAAETRLKVLDEQKEKFGLSGIEDRVKVKHNDRILELGSYVKGGKITQPAEYERVLLGMLSTDDPREIGAVIDVVAASTGMNPKEYLTSLKDAPISIEAKRALHSRMQIGAEATAVAQAKHEELSAAETEAMQTFNERTSSVPKYMQEYLKMSVLGAAGVEMAPEQLMAAFGMSPQAASFYTGEGGEGTTSPDGTVTRTGEKHTSSPFIEDNRQRIIAEIDALRAGSGPKFARIRDAMIKSDAFQTFKKQHGITDNAIAFDTWARVAKKAVMDSKKESRLATERGILSGDIDVPVIDQLGARITSGLRDLFGGKKGEPGLADTSRGEDEPTGDEPDDVPLDVSGLVDKKEAPAEDAKKAAAPGAEPSASEEKPSAAVVGGSSSSSPKVEAAGEAKPQEGGTTDYRIVNDPRNPDYIWRQYADGRLELIGTPNDKSISPKNPKAASKKELPKLEEVMGKYEAPESAEDKTEDSTTGISFDDDKEAEFDPPDVSTLDDVIVGAAKAHTGPIKAGASGPQLELDKSTGEVKEKAKPRDRGVEPSGETGKSKGKISTATERVDALVNAPKVDRKEALKPVELSAPPPSTSPMRAGVIEDAAKKAADMSAEYKTSGGPMNPLLRGQTYEDMMKRERIRKALETPAPAGETE